MVIRYPVPLRDAVQTADEIARRLVDALRREPGLDWFRKALNRCGRRPSCRIRPPHQHLMHQCPRHQRPQARVPGKPNLNEYKRLPGILLANFTGSTAWARLFRLSRPEPLQTNVRTVSLAHPVLRVLAGLLADSRPHGLAGRPTVSSHAWETRAHRDPVSQDRHPLRPHLRRTRRARLCSRRRSLSYFRCGRRWCSDCCTARPPVLLRLIFR